MTVAFIFEMNTPLRLFNRILGSLIAAFVVSFALAETRFDLNARAPVDQWFLVLVPALAVFVILFSVYPFLETQFTRASTLTRLFIPVWGIIAAFFSLRITHYELRNLPLLFLLSLALIVPAAPSIQNLAEAGGRRRVFGAWLFAIFFSFPLAGFLDDFYPGPIQVILLTVLLQAALGVGGYFFMGRARRVAGERWFDAVIHAGLFVLLTAFILRLFHASRGVSLFPASYFVLNDQTRGTFFFTSLLALPWQAWLHLKLKFSGFYNRLKSTRFYAYISANLAGLSLALAFCVLYLVFASVLNNPRLDVDDIFFDADGANYRIRLVTDHWQDLYQRSVHPFMLLLFKPPVDLLGFLLKGNKLWGAYLFTAMGGAACVHLAWMFVKSATENSAYASLIASLLGFSASHLIFGSLIESYIFLAASLILFFVLLIRERPLPALVAASLATIGITYTNFAQNVVVLFLLKPDMKRTMRFAGTVLVFLVLLTLLNNLLYPGSQPFFFVPSTLQTEQQNLFPLNALRVQALTRAFLFHNVAAPTPIFYDKDIPFIQFRFFKPEIDELSRYDLPIQNAAVWAWLGLLTLAGVLFLWNIRKNPRLRLSIALMGCMALNAGLHLRYGKELFLYSPNWTYALVLWVALAWRTIHDRKWFQALLLAFLFLLAWNNWILLATILDVLGMQV